MMGESKRDGASLADVPWVIYPQNVGLVWSSLEVFGGFNEARPRDRAKVATRLFGRIHIQGVYKGTLIRVLHPTCASTTVIGLGGRGICGIIPHSSFSVRGSFSHPTTAQSRASAAPFSGTLDGSTIILS
ncbi:hypothetical protein DFP72DRAFT_839430 [Ephemerocybe angulata]|uniref:Uncharacterized protein n=1 Tax=Ephemerocybe angulata TaxID=980116 RepID=A0A8H6MEG9_9AGAR|nr:hypothetical protein DFP72DRAFT_839430 [Tulosesus angulatus]